MTIIKQHKKASIHFPPGSTMFQKIAHIRLFEELPDTFLQAGNFEIHFFHRAEHSESRAKQDFRSAKRVFKFCV